MAEFGGPESFSPDEGGGSASEKVSEQAQQRFQAAQAAMQQIRAEEKRSKKRDDQVARTIVQFLGKDESSPLFLLISQLVARNCPSIFILAILSLISEPAAKEIHTYLEEHQMTEPTETTFKEMQAHGALPQNVQQDLIMWIVRMRDVMATDARAILLRLLIDEKNIDGTVLQLTTFVLGDHLRANNITLDFNDTRVIAIGILQTVFEPFLHAVDRKTLRARDEGPKPEEQ